MQVVEEGQVLAEFRAALRRRYKQQQLMLQQYPSHYSHLQEHHQQQQRSVHPSGFSRQLNLFV